jgi:hypothetical protein
LAHRQRSSASAEGVFYYRISATAAAEAFFRLGLVIRKTASRTNGEHAFVSSAALGSFDQFRLITASAESLVGSNNVSVLTL